MLKYLKSLVYENKPVEYNWVSGLIIFSDENKLVLDKGFIILGEVTNYSFYCQFNNFTMINGELHYAYAEGFKKIDARKVYLHLRFGKSPFEISLNNLSYWNLYFTNPKNKLYSCIDKNKIKIIKSDKTETLNIKDVKHPFFYNKQIYNNTSVLFSSLDVFHIK